MIKPSRLSLKPYGLQRNGAFVYAVLVNAILCVALLYASPPNAPQGPSPATRKSLAAYTVARPNLPPPSYDGLNSTTIPAGDVYGTWTKEESPYLIEGTITVPEDSSLIIEAGVEIIFQGNYQFIVNGRLEAVGTADDSIRFTAANSLEGWGGLRMIYPSVSSKLEYCQFTLGWAQGEWPDNCGGALYMEGSINAVKHCSFIENWADLLGGAVFLWGATPEFSYNLFSKNKAGSGDGHAIYMGENEELVLNHLTVAGNDLTPGYGITVANGDFLVMKNSILKDSSNFDFIPGDITYSCIFEEDSDTLNFMGIGNINSDPKFIDPDNLDYHLELNSPCVDAASPNSPYSNEPEPNGDRANMGAYGNSIYATQSKPLLSFSADSLVVDPDTVNFGLQKVDTPDTLNLNLSNLGRQTIEISALNFSETQFSSNFDSIADSTTGMVLIPPDSTVAIGLIFNPATVDSVEGTMTIEDNDPTSDPVVPLSGIGVRPIIKIEPMTFVFDTLAVGEAETQPLYITNIGENSGGILSLLTITTIYNTNNFRIEDSEGNRVFNDTIPVGDTLFYTAVFEPQDQLTYNDSLQIVNNAGDVWVHMSGTGSQPVVHHDPDSLEYGVTAIGDTVTMEFEVWNTGPAQLHLAEFELSDPVNYSYDFDTTQAYIAKDDAVTIAVSFHPTQAGTYNDTLTIQTNMPEGDEVIVYLFGTGTSQQNWVINEVSGAWLKASSPYFVVGDIYIPSEETLTIEPGVEVKFEGNFEISVYGTLIANGTEEDPIEFATINVTDSTWSGISFYSGSSESVLSYCILHRGSGEDGGVLRIYGASPTIDNCDLYDNTATRGGALALLAWAAAEINDCRFHHNSATSGGAIFGDWYAQSTITECQIDSNSATDGGGLYLSGTTGQVDHCQIFGNTASQKGGGFFMGDGAVTELFENDIYDNSAMDGAGGAILWSSKPFIHDVRIYANTASANGGGFFIHEGSIPVILKSLIVENSAVEGRAIYTLASGSLINYCTLTAESDATEGWLFRAGVGDRTMISNSILGEPSWAEVTHSAIKSTESFLAITYSDILDSIDVIYPGNGNDNVNPEFVGSGSTVAERYQLAATSPVLNHSESGDEIGFTGGSSSLTWAVTLALLQNPAQYSSMHFVLTSTIPLMSAPYVYIEQDRPDTVEYSPIDSSYMTQIAPMIYSLPYYQDDVDYPSRATFSFTNTFGNDTTFVQDFIASNLTSDGGLITFGQLITVSGRSASGSGLWYLSPEYYCEPKPVDPELLAIGQAYQVLAPGLELAEGRVEFALNDQILGSYSPEGCGIAYWNEDSWEVLPSYLSSDKSMVWAPLEQSGSYRLVWGEGTNTVMLPSELTLAQNYPNPFNPETVIEFALPEYGRVKLEVFNTMGRKVITLLDKAADPGYHQVRWGGVNAQGASAASGIYFYRLQVGSQVITKKMILLR